MTKYAKREKGKQRQSLERSIAELLIKKPLSVPELKDRLPATYWAIKKTIDRMEERGDVVRVEERKTEGSDRPETVYLYVGTVPLTQFMQVMDTAEAERAKAPEDMNRGVIHSIVTKTLHDPEFDEEKRREYFGKTAKALMRDDPRNLLLRFAFWLFKEHSIAVEKYRAAAEGKRPKEELEESDRTIESIERMVRVVFNRNLGIPERRNLNGKTENAALSLQFHRRNREVEQSFNEDEVKHHLELNVLGDAVLEKIAANRPKREYSEAGTDASIRKFDLSLFPTAFEKLRMAIVTAAAVRLNFYDPNPPQIDARPEPKQWRYYTEDDAIDKGLLVPPEAYLMLEEIIWERVTTAAMNLRQYRKDFECFDQDEYGRIPDILFRDGRVFPLEHLFDDYCQAGIHGRVVRKGIEAFRDIVDKASSTFPRLPKPLYCGAVKRPEVTILSPLVFWYMKYGSDPPIWPDMDDRKFILRTPMSDQRVAHYLFGALASEAKPEERWITCRFVRRFVSMNQRIAISTAKSYEDWIAFLQAEIDEHRYPSEPDVDPYAELCARAAVATFYASLPGVTSKAPEDYLTPRYEILLPRQITEATDPRQIRDYERQLVGAVLTALVDPKGIDIYPESLQKEPDDETLEPIFIFPKATTLAHVHTRDIGDVYKKDFLGYLWKIIIEVVKASKRKARYAS